MAYKYTQGVFVPVNRHKIIGDPNKIYYRSSWELKVFNKLDHNVNVLKWGSETLAIKYMSPKDNRVHRYFPDLIVVARGLNDTLITTMIEIKPYKQSIPPVQNGKKKQQFINECLTYAINQAKWKAAEEFCEKRGIRFTVMTEKEILSK